MAYVKIGKKYFELESRSKRLAKILIFLLAYLISGVITGIVAAIGSLLFALVGVVLFIIVGIAGIIFQFSGTDSLENFASSPVMAIIVFGALAVVFVSIGESIRREAPNSNKVIRLEDGKPCGFKEKFIRLLTLLLQPLDIFWMFWKDRQRLGDKLARTVVVKVGVSETQDTKEADVHQTKASEKSSVSTIRQAYSSVSKNMFTFWRKQAWKERMTKILQDTELLETTIREMKSRLAIAEKKLDAAIRVEKKFQTTYQKIHASAEQCYKDAGNALKIGREDIARKHLEKRNECRRLARQCKKRWEEQKQVVAALSNLLRYMQQKMVEVDAKKEGVDAQHINVATAADLRETLQKLQNNPLVKMEEDADATAILAKVEAETDIQYQQAESERKYDEHTKEEAIEDELDALKRKLQ